MFRVLFPRATKPPTPTITLLVGDRASAWHTTYLTITTPPFALATDYYVREDVGTADQLSFQGPFLPIALVGTCWLLIYFLFRHARARLSQPQSQRANPLRESSTLTLFRASAPLPDFPAATPPRRPTMRAAEADQASFLRRIFSAWSCRENL